jgi:hypothetical protein
MKVLTASWNTTKLVERDTYHCIHTIMLKTVFFLPLDIVRPQDLCEPPATGF